MTLTRASAPGARCPLCRQEVQRSELYYAAIGTTSLRPEACCPLHLLFPVDDAPPLDVVWLYYVQAGCEDFTREHGHTARTERLCAKSLLDASLAACLEGGAA